MLCLIINTYWIQGRARICIEKGQKIFTRVEQIENIENIREAIEDKP